jgi:hypothetical protein
VFLSAAYGPLVPSATNAQSIKQFLTVLLIYSIYYAILTVIVNVLTLRGKAKKRAGSAVIVALIIIVISFNTKSVIVTSQSNSGSVSGTDIGGDNHRLKSEL